MSRRPKRSEREEMVREILGTVADTWTLIVIEELAEAGELRFSRLRERIPGISQKMLTKTLRTLERDGLIRRTIFAVVPPRVDYRLTALGKGLSQSLCGVWIWAEKHRLAVKAARASFDASTRRSSTAPRL
jgi:DNA-binding HxlR family transcriptional regulator